MSTPTPHTRTLYIIDGYAQFFRAYHAIRTPMTSPVTKEPTNMTFGFVGMLLKLLRGEGVVGKDRAGSPAAATPGTLAPDYLLVAIDKSDDRGTFRSQLYPEYKANRPDPPEDLFPQVERCLDLLRTLNVPVIGKEGFEADDCVATIVKRLRESEPEVRIRIISKDKDLKQLLEEDRVELYDVHTDQLITESSLREETGLKPNQIIDMLALMGDTVDNVPGVEGVGPKTAAELVATYGTLDAVVAAAKEGKIKGKRGEKIVAAAPELPLSRELVTLRDDVPMDLDLRACSSSAIALERLIPILKELGFNRYQDEARALLGLAPMNAQGGSSSAASSASSPKNAGGGLFSGTSGDAGTGARSAGSTESKGKAGRSSSGASGSTNETSGAAPGLFDLFGASAASGGGPIDQGSGSRSAIALPSIDQLGIAGASTRGTYRCVTTTDHLRELVRELTDAPIFAFDTETTGLSPLRCKLCGLSFSTKAGTGWYVPVRSPTPQAHLDEATVLKALAPLLTDATKPKCGHNLKFDMLVLGRAGVHVRGIGSCGFDSMVASYLIDASRSSHGLDALALALLGHANISISELIGSGANQRTFDTVPIDLATLYAAEDADVSLRLMETMSPQVQAMGIGSLFRDVEMPLVEVLATLERNGITVDPRELDRQRERLSAKISEIRTKIDASAKESIGRTFNPDSPKQLSGVLFNKPDDLSEPGLGLKPVKKTKTGNSTDVEVLETLAEDASVTTPIPRLIVDYRQLTKLVGTYLQALKDEINPDTARVHASFNQTVAATGRLSSSDPNLQNIPIRTDVGREIRKAFVAAPGCVLISADYSQIELRLLAHLSRDPNLIEAFRSDQDIHTAVAAQINRVPIEQVTKAHRSGAKMVNFGIVYGITAFGLARRLGIDNAEAAEIIDGYKRRFAGITTFLQECVEQARTSGYVETMLKRRRPIPEIHSTNPSRRAFAERTAINSVVQGSAADLIKLAMVDLHSRIEANEPALRDVKMLLQIHDELVFEAPKEKAEKARKLIVERMESAMSLSVPIRVDSEIGTDWYEQ
ncbi:MAG: DNA polymerase I [Phycisphaerales bacterium]|nr:DNA polymerase I [Phycisphaerales bacterium]